ncbi:hypothetical protein MMC21_000088 [Puttea exsequens]|nr:hypothetical protein [Puttea exsequens]
MAYYDTPSNKVQTLQGEFFTYSGGKPDEQSNQDSTNAMFEEAVNQGGQEVAGAPKTSSTTRNSIQENTRARISEMHGRDRLPCFRIEKASWTERRGGFQFI